jgi:hypothetical protein
VYGGFTAGMSVPWYKAGDDLDDAVGSTPMPTFGGFLGWHIARFGLQIEALISFDRAEIGINEGTSTSTINLEGTSMLLPIVIKYDIPVKSFVIQPLIGMYFNVALGEMEGEFKTGGDGDGKTPYGNPPLGLLFGGDFGWKLKKGMLFLDARLAFDLGNTVISWDGDDETLWRKSAFTVSLGYQFN